MIFSGKLLILHFDFNFTQMKIFRYLLALALCSTCAGSFGQSRLFISPYTPQGGLRDAGSTIVTYRNQRSAMAGVADSSASYVNLNGDWKVKFLPSVAKVSPADLAQKNDLAQGWKAVTLPVSMEIGGSGTEAVFADKAYDFLDKPLPKGASIDIPNGGLTALYARDFTVPFDFLDKQLFLNIEGSRGKTTVFVNGQQVGFATNSKNQAQYDLTKFVSRGLNRLVLQVERFSGASWVENQQMWRLSGVNRNIFLLAQPKLRMRDFLVRTSLDPTYKNGLLEAALLLKTEQLNPHKVTVYYDLFAPDGKLVAQNSRETQIGLRVEDTVRFTTSIMNVQKWNAETPHLYTILYRVKREGRFTEYATVKVGFRQVEIDGKELLVNGVSPKIKGVNFEEFDDVTGNVISEQNTLAALKKMRLMGINAIRTGGYPLPSFFYDMTDSLGFYVVSVANVDASGLDNSLGKGRSVANDPAWKAIFAERAIAAYEQVKNKPSVVAIGLGQDAGNGYCMYNAYNAIKARDNNRIIVYDGAGAEWNTDVVCPLYPSIEDLKKLTVVQPIIPSRVKFDKRYWNTKDVQGAFIDRWVSPEITATVAGGKAILTNDYKIEKRAVKLGSAVDNEDQILELFAPIVITTVDAAKGVYEIENRMQYSDLKEFKVKCSIVSNGKIAKTIILDVACPAGGKAQITIPGASVISATRELLFEVGDIFKVIFSR